MTGKFLRRGAVIDLIKSQERNNSIQNREGLTGHPVRVTVCGCPAPDCGGRHSILVDRSVPTPDECDALLKGDKAARKRQKG